jgi:hypothetical protein
VIACRVRSLRLALGSLLVVASGSLAIALSPHWPLLIVSFFLLIDLFYQASRRATFDGDLLSFRSLHLRWRYLAVDQVIGVQMARSINGLSREFNVYTKRLGFGFTPIWWTGGDQFIVALADRVVDLNPNVKMTRSAKREIARARRRLGLPEKPF